MVHPQRTARALDTLWARGLLDYAVLHSLMSELGRPGRNGIKVMRDLIAERPPDFVPNESNNERRYERILKAGGEPPMRRQVNVGGKVLIGRSDFADQEFPEFLVEIASELFHSSPIDREEDEKRYAASRADGFELLVFWDWQLYHEPEKVLAAVRAVRARLRETRRAASG
jgi:very-short-patch-repair endonuclease